MEKSAQPKLSHKVSLAGVREFKMKLYSTKAKTTQKCATQQLTPVKPKVSAFGVESTGERTNY